ncbi:MAG TPA: iron-containing alcohol dehydrogenase, partial [Lentisphaerae bacterium]|nr:iron-containing alcohol dehydrogenase [Lentisphaerota bacterium]
KGLALQEPPLPHIAIPTTAGTGSEMTKNAVICSPERGFKKSMRFDQMIPTAAVVDPELTLSVPPHVTAFGGMDALTQLIESCITRKRRPEVTELALDALRNVQLGLSVAYEDPSNLMARERMSYVSSMSGICLANAGLAMAHGIAAALGALYNVPHGLACAVLLPHSLRFNVEACRPELAAALAAFMNLSHPDDSSIDEGLTGIESLCRWLQIPPDLKFLNLKEEDLRRLARASLGSSMSANPVPMTEERIYEFLKGLT